MFILHIIYVHLEIPGLLGCWRFLEIGDLRPIFKRHVVYQKNPQDNWSSLAVDFAHEEAVQNDMVGL